MSTAGKNLKYLRKLRGWTQEEFAVKLGIKRSLLGAYEEERAEPRLDTIELNPAEPRLIDTRDGLGEAGLPCSILAHKGVNLAGAQFEVHARDHVDPAEGHRNAARSQPLIHRPILTRRVR